MHGHVIGRVLIVLLGATVVVYLLVNSLSPRRHCFCCKNRVKSSSRQAVERDDGYAEDVDFRIIVLTYNRPVSLMKCLKTLDELELDGDTAALEIWIDISGKGRVDNNTIAAAKSFKWTKGPSCVHVQPTHAGIAGQWIDTWRPNADSRELSLILEDDMSVSPMAYRFVKAVHRKLANVSDFVGVTIQTDQLQVLSSRPRGSLAVTKNNTIFMYKGYGTWGFSPKLEHWRRFQVNK